MKWIDLKKRKPTPGDEVLVCDEFGYVCIERVDTKDRLEALGYPSPGVFDGNMPTFEDMWKHGNGTNLVAWMPLPAWPEKLCREDADGSIP